MRMQQCRLCKAAMLAKVQTLGACAKCAIAAATAAGPAAAGGPRSCWACGAHDHAASSISARLKRSFSEGKWLALGWCSLL
jgi:hypothetical protein